MIGISLTFPAGRYHATPWGRHVNEGAVEWPPSPWRLMRAFVATWKRTLPDLPQAQVEPILRKLAGSLPVFELPPASTGHTRHFMPWHKNWKPPAPINRTLVFDAFIVVPRDAWLIVRWPDAALDDDEREVLGAILQNLNTLGRAESWCEAMLLSDQRPEAANGRAMAAPLNECDPDADREIVRLLCCDPEAAFESDMFVNRSKSRSNRTAPPYDPDWHLCAETLWLHKERWSDPPGSRWIPYTRRRDCFKIEVGKERRPRSNRASAPQVVRYALDSAVLPLLTETLPVAESARRALMSIHGRLTEHDGKRGRSDVLSGKGQDGAPLQGHRHAYYLVTDEDGDGHLDHLTLVARDGLGPEEMHAVHRLREVKRRGPALPPLRVLLLGYGRLDEYQPPPLQPSREWISATPYIATRHAKTRGRHRIDLRSPEARAEFLISDLHAQISQVLAPEPNTSKIVPQWDDNHVFRLPSEGRRHSLRPIQFKRNRSKQGENAAQRLAGAFRIEFQTEVPGPVALGHASHFGMGLFLPAP